MEETYTKVTRKHARFVKIAHISDLHFSYITQFLDDAKRDPFLVKLADDLEREQPDVLCITGDIANSGLKAKGNRYQALRDTLTKARDFFEELCQKVEIDAGTALFIIPGNHDYRVQGFLNQSEQAIAIFQEVFALYFRNDHLLFEEADNELIAVTIVCIDSNGTDPIATFASGAITGSELHKFKKFDKSNQVFFAASRDPILVFRVCLLHHHPLPVVTAENYKALPEDPGIIDKYQEVLGALTGPQTTLLKNAGAFLSSALAAQVDLVLHGHQHKSWVSEVRYPTANTNTLHRLLVVAAGSAGVETDSSHTYNIITLNQEAGLTVAQRSVNKNLSHYKGQEYFVTPASELRELRYHKAVDFLRNRSIESSEYSAVNLFYGAVQADKMARVTWLQMDGNAYVTRSFEKLEATTDMEVRYLPLISHSPGGYQGVGKLPNIRIVPGGRHYNIELKRDDKAIGDWTAWILEFSPPLERGFPVTFEVSYLLCNGYEFVTEYRRARQAAEGNVALDGLESISNRARAVFLKRLSETIIFPPEWPPPGPPRVCIYNSNRKVERFEQDYCAKWLQFTKGAHIVSLTVDLPLPDVTYELTWSLQSKSEYEKQRYSSSGISWRRQIAYREYSNEITETLKRLLNQLKQKISLLPHPGMAVVDNNTEFTIYIVHFTQGDLTDRPSVKTLLTCCAQLSDPEPQNVSSNSFDMGVGLVGQAYRKERVIYDTSEGRSGLYIMGDGQTRPHSFLCAVPLSVPVKRIAGDNLKTPIYAVLCFGSYVAGSGLELILDKTPEGAITRLCVLDLITGEFNNNVFSTLTEVAKVRQ